MGNSHRAIAKHRLGHTEDATAKNMDKFVSKMIDNKEWVILSEMLKENPEYAEKKQSVTLRLPLHIAMIKGAPLDIIKLLIDLYPKALSIKDSDQLVPFHLAIFHKVDIEILKYILRKDEASAREYDGDGKLPIHFACANSSSEDVIHILLQAYPDSASRRTKSGQLPLHYACQSKCNSYIIAELVEAYPSGVTEGFKSKLPIHYACENKATLASIKILAKESKASLSLTGGNNYTLPLAFACANRQTYDVIEYVYSQNPDALTIRDESNRLPLHFALENSASPEIIYLLVNGYKESVRAQGRGGMIPLHTALELHAPTEAILFLLDHYPQATEILDIYSVSPLKKAIKNKLADEVVLKILDAYPTAASELDEYERVPLHYAASKQFSGRVINALIEACPDSAKVVDKNGQLPLHISAKRGGPLHCIELLLKAFPGGVHCTDTYRMSPLHHALVEHDVKPEIIKAITKTDRSCCKILYDGRLPLHLALDHKREILIIKNLLKYYPQGAEVKDERFGRIPLLTAIRRQLSLEYVELIEHYYPLEKAAKEQDHQGAMAIHYTLKYKYDVGFFIKILHAYPDIVYLSDLALYHDDKIDKRYNDDDDDHVHKELKFILDVKKLVGKQLLHYAIEDLNSAPEYVSEIIMYTMPYRTDGSYNDQHNFTWTYLLSELNDRYEATVIDVLNRYHGSVDIIRSLTDVPNEQGIRARDCATQLCRLRLLERLYFYKRYEWADRPPIHLSQNSIIRLAIDKRQNNNIVIKLSKDAHQFHREIDKYVVSNFDSEFIVPILDTHDGDMDEFFLKEVRRIGYDDYRYAIVMPAAECNFQFILLHELVVGLSHNKPKIIEYFLEVLHCVEHLHSKGLIHGNIKPLNIVRDFGPNGSFGRLKLIDMGACCDVLHQEIAGKYASKLSPAWLPPEMMKNPIKDHVVMTEDRLVESDESDSESSRVSDSDSHKSDDDDHDDSVSRTSLGNSSVTASVTSNQSSSPSHNSRKKRKNKFKSIVGGLSVKGLAVNYTIDSNTGATLFDEDIKYASSDVNLVVSNEGIDIWQLGVLLYYLLTAEPLFHCTIDDQMDNYQRKMLFEWSNDVKLFKLNKIYDIYARNLVCQMLHKEVRRRPPIQKILIHPFITQIPPARYPGMDAKYDVCLVYRRKRLREGKKKRGIIDDDSSDDEGAVGLGVRKIKLKAKVYNDDKHVDEFRTLLEAQLNLKVTDCYDENGLVNMNDKLNCMSMIQSKAVIVLLSRHAINYNENSFERLTNDSTYDHMLLQLRLVLELRESGLIENGVHVMAIGDLIKKDNSTTQTPTTITPSTASDEFEYATYYEKYEDKVLGRYGGSHPMHINPAVHVRSVEVELVKIFYSNGLGVPLLESASVLDILSKIISCPTFAIIGHRFQSWLDALKWFAIAIGIKWTAESLGIKTRDRANKNVMYVNQKEQEAARLQIQRIAALQRQYITEDFDANVSTIRLLIEKLESKEVEVENINKELVSIKKKESRERERKEKEAAVAKTKEHFTGRHAKNVVERKNKANMMRKK